MEADEREEEDQGEEGEEGEEDLDEEEEDLDEEEEDLDEEEEDSDSDSGYEEEGDEEAEEDELVEDDPPVIEDARVEGADERSSSTLKTAVHTRPQSPEDAVEDNLLQSQGRPLSKIPVPEIDRAETSRMERRNKLLELARQKHPPLPHSPILWPPITTCSCYF